MPIAASFSTMQTQIKSAFNLEIAGNPDLTALMITQSIATASPMGLFPVGNAMIPLSPTGFSACKSQIKSAFNLEIAGNPDLTALMIAQGISYLCPIVPPIGLTLLKEQIKTALNLEIAGNPQLNSTLIASGIITYFTSGMVI